MLTSHPRLSLVTLAVRPRLPNTRMLSSNVSKRRLVALIVLFPFVTLYNPLNDLDLDIVIYM